MERRIPHGNSLSRVSRSEDSVAGRDRNFCIASDKSKSGDDGKKCLKYIGDRNSEDRFPTLQIHEVRQVMPDEGEEIELILPEEAAKRRLGDTDIKRKEEKKEEEEEEEGYFEESSDFSSKKPTITFSHVCTITESDRISFDAIRKCNSRSPSPLLEVPASKSGKTQATMPPL